MKDQAFTYNSQKVFLIDAYSDVNSLNCIEKDEPYICETCLVFLENAYSFRKMCQNVHKFVNNACRCCLYESEDSHDLLLKMKTESFLHNNNRITFIEGYLDVNKNSVRISKISEAVICGQCAVQMESAYIFQRMCENANGIFKGKCLLEKLVATDESREGEMSSADNDLTRSSGTNELTSTIDISGRSVKHRIAYKCKKCARRYNNTINLNSHRILKHRNIHSTRDLFVKQWKRKSALQIRHRSKELSKVDDTEVEPKKLVQLKQKYAQQEKAIQSSSICKNEPTTLTDRKIQRLHESTTENSTEKRVLRSSNKLDKISQHKIQIADKPKNVKIDMTIKHTNTQIQSMPLFHDKHVRQPSEKYACKECKKIYRWQQTLNAHNKAVHQNFWHQCKKCPKVYQTSQSLEMHIQVTHFNKRYQCPTCKKFLNGMSSLRLHIKSIHLKERYACNICSKIYPRRQGLRRHFRLHLNDRATCKICEKSFSDSDGLRQHNNSVHLKIQYKCKECPNVYANKPGLIRHNRDKHA
jgi:hypothetical protein